MKRHLLNVKLRMQSGMKRLEDLRPVFPDMVPHIEGVLSDLQEANQDVDYLLSRVD